MTTPQRLPVAWIPLLFLALSACGARTGLRDVPEEGWCEASGETRPCSTVCGEGLETCVKNEWVGCTAQQPKPPAPTLTLQGWLRDLRDTHPDVEKAIGDDKGMVEKVLGDDGTPVYAGKPATPTTHGKDAFFSWFHDVGGVNAKAPLSLTLARGDGLTYLFDAPAFFPADNILFGNEGRPHNFHFTVQIHATFAYRGGETLTFRGDDDVWVFLNRRLALDLGGVHGAETASVSLDARKDELGLTVGELHDFDLFFAERHANESSFHVETTITGFSPCD